MTYDQLSKVLKANKTVKAQYRTEYNFLEWNIILSSDVLSENINGVIKHFVYIGNLKNKVYLDKIIKAQSAWLA